MALLNKLVKFGIYAAVFLGALLCSLYLTSTWIIQSEEEVHRISGARFRNLVET
ncbi:MAG: hypothetical protein P8X67_14120 [Syntrophobacterales bacterium]